MRPFRLLSTSIARPFAETNAFLGDPSNMSLWAAGLGRDFEHVAGQRWRVNGFMGRADLDVSPPNPFGVADHVVHSPRGDPVYMPMRVVPDGEHSLVTITLFHADWMTPVRFEALSAAITRDLWTLKEILETRDDGDA